ncbi:MAG: alpha-1,6-glucosidase domain-containing protein, partial [Rubrivivax sp.]
NWTVMKPLLANPALKPRPQDIAWTREAFHDLLRIRAGTTLLRLRTAADIQARLTLLNTGPNQVPTVVGAHIDGQGYAGARFKELAYFVNVHPSEAQTVTVDALKGRPFVLHPVHRAPTAADGRARQATYLPATGAFAVPPRTAVVFVVE